MVHISIVEDEDEYAGVLQQYLTQYQAERGTELCVTRYRNGAEFLEHYTPETDIVLMDIDLPVMDGMRTAEELRKLDRLVILIFVTNLTQYAVQGYSVNAMDYLIKPVRYAHFALKLDKAMQNLPTREDWFAIPSPEGLTRVSCSRVYYVEGSGHRVIFHTADGDIAFRSTLKAVEAALKARGFARPSNSFLVNLQHVQSFRRELVVVHGKEFTIGRSRRVEFLDAMNTYLGGHRLYE